MQGLKDEDKLREREVVLARGSRDSEEAAPGPPLTQGKNI
jgi:hypothetical protein